MTEIHPEALTGVSYIMPVLNEVSHVSAAVDSLLAQDYEGPFDVTLALGPSIDGTDELVAQLSAADARIRVIENEIGSTPSGLNLAIAASQYPVIVRVDAHSILPRDYARIAVETMQRTGADNVGGVMDAQGRTPFEVAVARAYGSPIGLGGTRLHTGGSEGAAETVYLGVYRRSTLERVGVFDEDIKRGQDWELNRRIRENGGTIWFTPELTVLYRPRSSLRSLARQFVSTGIWRGELVRRFPASNGLRYLAPPIMVVGVAIGIIAGVVGLVQALAGAPGWLMLGFIIPAVYAVIVIASAVRVGRDEGARSLLWFLVVLPCIHFCWGIGFVLGVLALTRNITAHTGR